MAELFVVVRSLQDKLLKSTVLGELRRLVGLLQAAH